MLRRHLGLTVVAGEGVFLVCEHGSAVVEEPVAQRILALLDGRTLDAVVAAVAGEHDGATVRVTVEQLVAAGLVGSADPGEDPRSAGYWESAGLVAADAEAGAGRPVRLHTVGMLDRDGIAEALAVAGLRLTTGPDPALELVLTDDYLHPALTELDTELRSADRPWLLAKPVGIRLHVGPIFEPGEACYQCLAVRLRGHRPVEQYLSGLDLPSARPAPGRAARYGPSWPAPPPVDVAATRTLGVGLVATAAVNWLAGHRTGARAVTVLDALTSTISTHQVHRRPQCPGCGDPTLVTARMSGPVRPTARRAVEHRDGGHRARAPAQMLADHAHLVDPLTGVVPALVPMTPAPPFVHVYSAGPNRALPVRSLRSLRSGLRTQSCGKGSTDVQARASALGEAMERASGVFHGDEPRIRASYNQLGGAGLHPNVCQLFSERQFAERAVRNRVDQPSQWVPDPLDPAAELDWTPVWSLTAECHRYLPTSLLFFGYPTRGPLHCWADSNGNAAGTSVEDACLQGCYEVVERDSVAIWWYNRLRRPAVDLDDPPDSWIDRLRSTYTGLGREVWALDVTADLGIPAVAALSRRTDKPAEDIIFGFGAHTDGRIALRRAFSELNQFLPAVMHVQADGAGYASADPTQLHWWRSATLAEHPYLLPAPDRPATRFAEPAPDDGDLALELAECRTRLEQRGLEVLAIDMTRPDIGLPVMKVIVPGMRHFWERFAPGRLYEVPVSIGALSCALEEDQLNPVPIFV